MASGHVNRTNRPNTWLHRPSLRREDSPCQPGAVHTWHFSEVTIEAWDFRLGGQSRLNASAARVAACVTLSGHRSRFRTIKVRPKDPSPRL